MESCLPLAKANGLKPGAHREPIKADQRQMEECVGPAFHGMEGANKSLLLVGIRTFDSGWIVDAPVRD